MAKLTWKKEFNGYEINLSFMCHYKDGFIVKFDSHDMTDNINKIFNDNDSLIKMDFLEISKYLFDKFTNLYSVEFVSNNTKSEYFREDAKDGIR